MRNLWPLLLACCGAPVAPVVVAEPPPPAPIEAPIEAPLALRSVRSHAARQGPHYVILDVIAGGDASYALAADGFTGGELVGFEPDGAPAFRTPLSFEPAAMALDEGGVVVVGRRQRQVVIMRVSREGSLALESTLSGDNEPWAVVAIDDGLVITGGVADGTGVFHARLDARGEVRWQSVSPLAWSDLHIGVTKTLPFVATTADSIYTAGPFGENGGEPGLIVQRRRLSDGEVVATRALGGFFGGAAAYAPGRLAVATSRTLWILNDALEPVREESLSARPLELAFRGDELFAAVAAPHDGPVSLTCMRLDSGGLTPLRSWDDMVMHPLGAALAVGANGVYVAYTVYVGRATSGEPDHVAAHSCTGEGDFVTSSLEQSWPGPATEHGPALVALEHGLRLAVTNGYALVWADLAP